MTYRIALAWLLVGSFCWAATVSAQSQQYTAPGSSGTSQVKTAAEIEAQMADARWHLGPVRLAPWIGLRNVTYVDNALSISGEEGSDLTGSAGAGLTAYLPTGGHLFWIAQALPEYLWWLDHSERDQIVGRYGAGLFADFNRLRLGLNGQRIEEQSRVTSETEQYALARRDRLQADALLAMTAATSLVLGGSTTDFSDRSEVRGPGQPAFEQLDRQERAARGGLRYTLSNGLELEAGVEVAEVEFEPGARDFSNRGTSPYARVHVDGNRIDVDADVVQRSMEPTGDSLLVPVDTTTGSLRVAVVPRSRFSIGAYAHRSTVYSLDAAYTQFDEERLGLELAAPFERIALSIFAETGENRYETALSAASRTDDALAWGARIQVEIREWASYRLGFQRVEYDSNQPGFDREVDRIEGTFSLKAGSWVWQ